jgi:hypothetical protein
MNPDLPLSLEEEKEMPSESSNSSVDGESREDEPKLN